MFDAQVLNAINWYFRQAQIGVNFVLSIYGAREASIVPNPVRKIIHKISERGLEKIDDSQSPACQIFLLEPFLVEIYPAGPQAFISACINNVWDVRRRISLDLECFASFDIIGLFFHCIYCASRLGVMLQLL